MRSFLHSIRLRLTLWYGAMLAVALGIFASSVYLFVSSTLHANVDNALNSYAQQVRRSAVHAVRGGHLDVQRVDLPPVVGPEPIIAFRVMNRRGQVKSLTRLGQPDLAGNELGLALQNGQAGCGTLRGRSESGPERFCTQLIYRGGVTAGGVEVVESMSSLNRDLGRLVLALILGVPFALLLAGAGGWVLAGRVLEPVDAVTAMARSISATDLSRRINLHRPDELGRLADTFDEMIDRLDRAFEEQRRLTAAVSHELRSPLTILQAQTTLILRRERPGQEYRQALRSMQEEVEHMSGIVEQLLILARAEAGESILQVEPLALGAVVAPVVASVDVLAAEKGVAVQMCAAPAGIKGDPGRIRQLLLNLLDNALRHTPTGGRIDITIATVGEHAVLSVADTGEGIASEDLPHVFERFYRGDRARRRGGGNAGLGLTIVAWIVEAHGGKIHVRSRPGEGAVFTVRFPLLAGVADAPSGVIEAPA